MAIRLSGLWKTVFENGDILLSGSFGSGRVVIRKNTHKTTPSDPDYLMYLEEKKPANSTDQTEADL